MASDHGGGLGIEFVHIECYYDVDVVVVAVGQGMVAPFRNFYNMLDKCFLSLLHCKNLFLAKRSRHR